MTSSNGSIFRATGLLCLKLPSQRPDMGSIDAFFDLRLDQQLSKRSSWRHYNAWWNRVIDAISFARLPKQSLKTFATCSESDIVCLFSRKVMLSFCDELSLRKGLVVLKNVCCWSHPDSVLEYKFVPCACRHWLTYSLIWQSKFLYFTFLWHFVASFFFRGACLSIVSRKTFWKISSLFLRDRLIVLDTYIMLW